MFLGFVWSFVLQNVKIKINFLLELLNIYIQKLKPLSVSLSGLSGRSFFIPADNAPSLIPSNISRSAFYSLSLSCTLLLSSLSFSLCRWFCSCNRKICTGITRLAAHLPRTSGSLPHGKAHYTFAECNSTNR